MFRGEGATTIQRHLKLAVLTDITASLSRKKRKQHTAHVAEYPTREETENGPPNGERDQEKKKLYLCGFIV